MTTHNVRDELIENEIRSQTLRARMLDTHRIDTTKPGEPVFVRRDAIDDDAQYQEGAAAYRKQQVEYSLANWGSDAKPIEYQRHTCEAAPPHRRRTDRAGFLSARLRGAGLVMILIALVLAAVLCFSQAHAQTSPAPLVRSCPTLPTTNGFSACSASTWSTPGPNLILDVLRSGMASDVWVTPNQLLATDRVFACEDPTITPGPFKNCPSLLPGQTDNWLKASAINFGTVVTPPPPPTGNGTLKLSWEVPTTDSTGALITQPLSYQVFVRATSCSSAGPNCQPDYIGRPPSADVSTAATNLSLAAGPYCLIVEAYFAGSPSTLGPPSDELCVSVAAGVVTPGKVTGVRAN